ncbi:peroxiredoxin Q/BCP [Arcanobacterium pluranimalium]|uniref:thioredoxin-dependent thiol peroxidase n=1 Tax=Arcanobacterium pluranimalium TaxID=108028 RepID=UPI001956283D|nr:thioredoxin-dependent thiol peroxidase [Arcanobacterium pluranimalium]MBM7825199.1 peroxiredoxin Q/BCP [Arcanobacterium pluranimalium]
MPQLTVGDIAPDFTLPTLGGGHVTLSEAVKESDAGVIVYFYPRAMTPGCTKQACDFRDSEQSLASAGYTVIGISPDKVESLQKFTDKEALNFPLASDPDKHVMEAWGAFGEKKNYGKLIRGVIRSTIVVGKDGTVKLAQYNVKATGHVARLRKELGIDE